MSTLFSPPKSPKIPDPPAPEAPPSTTDAAAASAAEADRVRRRRGAASTVLAGESSARPNSVATKTLLGQ
ncbi:hypothetical protein NJI34_37840 [Pseudomonas sp. S 311-6]|nr:hypothetical protein CBF45_12730 [Bordetella sp. J329]MCO7642537.1 hypothetical protein [Pseudomonas sp. S 311-6]